MQLLLIGQLPPTLNYFIISCNDTILSPVQPNESNNGSITCFIAAFFM